MRSRVPSAIERTRGLRGSGLIPVLDAHVAPRSDSGRVPPPGFVPAFVPTIRARCHNRLLSGLAGWARLGASATIPRCPTSIRPSLLPDRTRSGTPATTASIPWFWLSDRDDPEVLAYLEAENAYTEHALEHLDGVPRGAVRRDRERVQETDDDRTGPPHAVRVLRPDARRAAVPGAVPTPGRNARPPRSGCRARRGTAARRSSSTRTTLADGLDFFAVGDLTRQPGADPRCLQHRHHRR